MKYPVSELADRYSILYLKTKRLTENEEVLKEFKMFKAAILEYGVSVEDNHFIEELISINGRIWDLESEIRRGMNLPVEEVGRRALLIRDINAERIATKNKIADKFGEFQEVKVDHGSAKQ